MTTSGTEPTPAASTAPATPTGAPATPTDDRRIVAIHMAPGTRLAMRAVDTAELRSGGGIVGDRYENARHRHVRVAAPCKIMDDAVGPGAHRAMRHRGGVICRVLEGGVVAVGNCVTPI